MIFSKQSWQVRFILLIAIAAFLIQCNQRQAAHFLEIGMNSGQVHNVLGKSKPDSVKGAQLYYGADLLGVRGTCIVQFDSVGKLSFFLFKVPWKSKDMIKENALLLFGKPTDTIKTELSGHFWVTMWTKDSDFYAYSEMGDRCSVGGGRAISAAQPMRPVMPPN